MIRLHQFAPAFGLPNASPFCMKLETWLRMAGLPYELVNDGNVMKAPRGKLPYIEDGAQVIGDSHFIIEYLKQTYGDPLDADLTPAEQAVATAFQRLLEEDLYWAVVHTRWADESGWARTRQAFFGALPPPLRWIVPAMARRAVLSELRGHGMGRHDPAEIAAIGGRDIDALATFLAGKPFLLGERPRSIDACAYAFVANLLWAPFDSPLRERARTHANLEAYAQRMKARYFG